MPRAEHFEPFDENTTSHMGREFRTLLAQTSKGMSPLDLGLATMDWISHLAISPEGPASSIERRMSGDTGQGGLPEFIDRVNPVPAPD